MKRLIQILSCLAALTASGIAAQAAAAASTPTVRVDFAKSTPRHSLVGFTHGMDMAGPPSDLITPLRPVLWRGKLRDVPYDRVRDLGGLYTYVLSDRWGYPGDGAKAPYDNYRKWERFVRGVARYARDKGRSGVWDVWNEPDGGHFWQGTREQFYETWRIAENVLRQELGPDVLVSGPSTTSYRYDWVQGLLEWCRTRGCQVNALTWHELGSEPGPRFSDHARQARSLSRSAPYAAQRVSQIHVSESGSQTDQYRPGEGLGNFNYLEAGGVDVAARACWTAYDRSSNCYNDTLAGLLTPGTHGRRSVWWSTKAYADGVASRRLTRFSSARVVGLGSAGSDRPDAAQLLIGRVGRSSVPLDSSPVNVKVTLRSLSKLRWLRGKKKVRIAVEKYPDSGEAALAKPVGRRSSWSAIRKSEAELTLHGVRPHEAYRLRLTAR